MRKSVRLGLIVVAPVFLLLLGFLFLRAGGDSRADEPVFSVASTWPPIHRNLSRTSDKYSRATDFASNGDDIVAVWSEGFTANDSYNGLVRMAWNGVTKGEWVEKDVYIEGGRVGTAPSVALDGNYAHFVWVSDIASGTTREYRVLYRKFNLNTGAWVGLGWESIYPPTGYSTSALGTPKIAVDSNGTPHVVWVQTVLVLSEQRDRIYYSSKPSGGSWSSTLQRISGGFSTDSSLYSEDMPEIAPLGTDVYVAWREKSAGDTSWGIYAHHRGSGGWEADPDGNPMGYRVSTGKYDEAPTMDAAGNRVYLAWDRWLSGDNCNGLDQNCYQVYSVTYRVHTNASGSAINANWYPNPGSTGSRDVTVNSSSIEAMAIISTPKDVQTGAPILLEPGMVPSPEGYLSGVRPSLDVIYANSVYTPYIVWHHWANESNLSDNVNSSQPYQIRGAYGTGSAGAEEWEYISEQQNGVILAMRSDGIFAAPSLVMLPGPGGVYDYHVVLNMRVSSEPVRWDVLYTNPYDFEWIFLPAVFRDYP